MGTASRTQFSSGILFLSVPGQDAFYAEDVKFYSPYHNQGTFPEGHRMIHTYDNGTMWRSGTKEEFFHIELDKECTLIEGIYADINPFKHSPYTVTIYIELEI